MSVWKEIVDYTVPSNTTSVVLDNFGTITKDDFISFRITHINPIANGNELKLFPNNNTTETNYHTQELQGSGSTVSASRVNRQRFINTNDNQPNFVYGYLKLSENDKFNIFSNSYRELTNAFSQFSTTFYYITSTSSFSNGITSLTLASQRTNGLGAGSRIQIYKLAAKKVADITVASNTTQVDITGLDIKKGDEYLLVADMINGASNDNVGVFPNDLTTSSQYFTQRIRGAGSSASAERANVNRVFTVGEGGQSGVGYAHIKISNIGAYTAQGYNIFNAGTSTPQIFNEFVSSTYENLTTITKLNIKANNGNLSNGHRYQLYKLYEGGN